MKIKKLNGLIVVLAAAIVTSIQSSVCANDYYWTNNGTGGDFTNASNWFTNGVVAASVPVSTDNAYFTNNAAFTINWTANATNANAYFGANSGSNSPTLKIGASVWWMTNGFVIGQNAGETGSVSFYNGTLVVTNSSGTAAMVVGQSGKGTFTFNSALSLGKVTVDQLFVTNGANSIFNFGGGTLNVLHGSKISSSGGSIMIGSGSGFTAIWNILGGTNYTTSVNTYLGESAGGSSRGVIAVSGSGTVWTNVGVLRLGAGPTTVNNSLTVTNSAQFYNNGITYIGQGSSSNMVVVTGSNSLWYNGSDIVVGRGGVGNALTIADGGQVIGMATNRIGQTASTGSNSVVVTGSNSLWDARFGLNVGEAGSSNNLLVIQNGGEVRVGADTVIGLTNGSTGNAITISAGTLTVTNASASIDVRRGALNLNGGTVNVNSLYATNGVNSVVNLQGGTLLSVRALIGSGSTLSITGAANQQISGVLTNAGVMSVMNSFVVYGGNVVNLGAYVSDPSTNNFNGNFTIGPTATVVVTSGDIYAFGSNFLMQSTNRAFNMSTAVAYFGNTNYGITTGTTNHTFDLTGSGAVDMGANWANVAQLATNFSIGTLSIASNNNLTVTGDHLTNALYVGWLDLSAWTTNAANLSTTLSNALTLASINLYYDAGDARNAYLQDASYTLWGSGGLLIPIPEPSALMLTLAAGAVSVFILRRKGGRR